ncbi:hypothetical protein S7711_08722 [Stachybotrys chartarum IBT 7711]|uniref:Uncharacterized protein n=1 Tax=Stachybotrys chartarum (strain CBS 109288 / IBT 7711) TaxID=1280523 RepID=A0A084AKF4_STACB|nr:hypothetical protein S7711_08722 [Stachybotrys chartarum IBT 7711]KFA46605.1 hypothetical protein S40293_08539 [Stachybotrys chartarum IBT 40293]KFA73532.1 hypothetical protein S40288_07697 [Stachybotrys chartarum IBT 40288]
MSSDSLWLRLFGGHRLRATPPTHPASTDLDPPASILPSGPKAPVGDDDRLHRDELRQPFSISHELDATGSSTVAKMPTRPRENPVNKTDRIQSTPSMETPGAVATAKLSAQSRDIFFNGADPIHCLPSVDDMADSLRIVMMTSARRDTIPREYNANVLYLLEAYWQLKKRLADAESRLRDLQAQRVEDEKEAAAATSAWAVREAQYKSEIKRLEKVIHTGSAGGLEAVMIARSGSLVRRRGASQPDATGPAERPGPAERLGVNDVPDLIPDRGTRESRQHSLLGRLRVTDPKNDVDLSRQFRGSSNASDVTHEIIRTADPREDIATGDERTLAGGSVQQTVAPPQHRRNFSFVPGQD